MSIIIPAYNTAPYIHRAIESSLRQTHKNVEVLVIDDGSSDETLSVARSYEAQDSRVRVFTQKNAGVSVARNLGIREAHGEYMMFLDSDDWLEDNAVEFLLNAQTQYPNSIIAVNCYELTQKTDGSLSRFHYFAYQKNTPYFFDAEKAIAGFNHRFLFECSWSKFFKLEKVRECSLQFHEDLHINEDGVFFFEYIHMVGSVVYINQPLWNILMRPSSATHTRYNHSKLVSIIKANQFRINYPLNTAEEKKQCEIYNASQ